MAEIRPSSTAAGLSWSDDDRMTYAFGNHVGHCCYRSYRMINQVGSKAQEAARTVADNSRGTFDGGSLYLCC